jgi:hypothetical protein
MPKKRAYVYKETKGIDEYRVYPGVVILDNASDTFELVNLSGDPADLQVPAGVFDGGAVNQSIGNGNVSGDKTPLGGRRAAEYKVEVRGKRAKGNSDPVIIIDL